MALPLVHAFGLAPTGGVLCLDEGHVVFPVGRHVLIANAETRTSTFLMPDHFEKVARITAMAISPNRKHLASGEIVADAEPSQLSVFTIATGKRTRALPQPIDFNVFQWRAMAFTADSKVLVALGDAPDYALVWWQWDKSKVLGYAKVGQPAFTLALSIPPPSDVKDHLPVSTCAVLGPKVLRFFKVGEAKSDGAVKAASAVLGKRELLDYTGACWLDDERMLTCASTGEVSVFESLELKQVLANIHPGGAPLRCILPFARGFIVGGDRGLLSLHELTEDNAFVPIKMFTCSGALAQIAGIGPERRADAITSLSLSPSEDTLYCASGDCQVSSFPLKDADILRSEGGPGGEEHFVPLSGGFHAGAVHGIDVCARKPLLASCGADRTVRVWNYLERTRVQARQFAEEPLAVTFHPSGYHLVVGFADKVRFFNLLVGDLKLVHEINLKMCREVRFSSGGHMFACASGPTVSLYGTYSLELLGTLKGHAGSVRSLDWSSDDLAIATCGVDGAVYEWAVDGLGRVDDHVLKSAQYNAVLVAERGSAAGGAGSGALATAVAAAATAAGVPKPRARTRIIVGSHDGRLRELQGGQVTKDIELVVSCANKPQITQLLLAPADRVNHSQILIVARGDGALQSFQLPLDVAEPHAPPQASHRGAVSRVRITSDGSWVFSAGEDGALFMYGRNAAVVERQAIRLQCGLANEDDFSAASANELDTVLVSAAELSERLSSVKDLEKQISDKELQAEFRLHQREAEFARALKKEKEEAAARADEATQRYEALGRARDREGREAVERERGTDVAHLRAAEELEHVYERKLAAEAARYESLAQQKADLQSAFEERMLQMQLAHTAQLERYRDELEEQRLDALRVHAELQTDQTRLMQSYEEELSQEDRDNEDEVERIRRAHDAQVRAEREEALKYKGDSAIMRKQFESSRADMQKLRNSLDDRDREIKAIAAQLADADKMVAMLRKDVRDREDTIADKERRMAELKSKNKELEKFKYVLDYKLRELKRELEPRDEALNRMRSTVTELDDELQREFKSNVGVSQDLTDSRAKIDSISRELKRERGLLAERDRTILSFGRDLHRLVTYTDPTLWRDAIKEIYTTYVKDASSHSLTEGDAAEHELHRQREYMERAIDTLKGRVSRSEDKRAFDQRRKVGENQTLLYEVNLLRIENKELKGRVHALGSQLEISESRAKPRVSLSGAPAARAGMASSSSSIVSLSRPQTGSASGLRSAGPGDSTDGLPSVALERTGTRQSINGMRASASVGQIARGSAVAGSRERTRVAEMISQLDENNREMGAQRTEIRRLRDQVSGLLGQGAATNLPMPSGGGSAQSLYR